jgi:hypothetical protein
MSVTPLTAPIALDSVGGAPKPPIMIGERSTKNEDGSVTTPLQYPVKSEGQPLDLIKMRRATGKELREVEGLSSVRSVLALIGKLGALAPSTVDQLDAEDIGELGQVLAHFLPKDRRIGAGSA